MNEAALLEEIDKRYSHKKLYNKKDVYYPSKEKFEIHKDNQNLINLKVDAMCKEISGKYKIEESQLYDELYLRVRKLFLELM